MRTRFQLLTAIAFYLAWLYLTFLVLVKPLGSDTNAAVAHVLEDSVDSALVDDFDSVCAYS